MSANERLEEARAALDAGRAEEALALLAALAPEGEEERGEGDVLACSAWLELGETARADEALARATRALGADDPWIVWCASRVRLEQWRLEEAGELCTRLRELGDEPWALEGLAILADLAGEERRAEELSRELHARWPAAHPEPVRLTPDEFHALVGEAARALPPAFRSALGDLAVVIDPMPSAEILGAPASGYGPETLGLFVGRAEGDPSFEAGLEPPPTIFLFQRNLERVCGTRAELAREVATTLYHELGHALGFDEEGVEDLGLA